MKKNLISIIFYGVGILCIVFGFTMLNNTTIPTIEEAPEPEVIYVYNYIEANVVGHDGTSTIFQEAHGDKTYVSERYFEDDSPYLLDVVDGEILVVWRVDEGSLG